MRLNPSTILLFLTLIAISCTSAQKNPSQKFRGPSSEKKRKVLQIYRTPFDNPSWSTEEAEAGSPQVRSMDPKLQACAVSTCGPTDQNLSVDDLLNRQTLGLGYGPGTPEYEKLDSLLKELVEFVDADLGPILKEIEHFANKNSVYPSTEHQRYINGILLFYSYTTILLNEVDSDDLAVLVAPLTITREMIERASLELEVDYILKAQQTGFFEHIRSYLRLMFTPMEVYLKSSAGKKNYQAQFVKMLEDCINFRQTIFRVAQIPERMNRLSYCETVKNQSEALPVSAEKLWTTFNMTKLFSEIWDPAYDELLDSRPVNLGEVARTYKTSEQFRLLVAQESLDKSEIKRSVIGYCHEKLGMNLEVAGSSLRRNRLLENIEAIKLKASRLIHFSSSEENKRFADDLDKLRFQVPYARQDQFELMVKVLEKEILDFKEMKALKNDPKYFGYSSVFTWASGDRSVYNEAGHRTNEFTKITNICQQFELETLSDHVYTVSGAAYLSWITSYYPNYGLGVVAHEVGHFVARQLIEIGMNNLIALYGSDKKAVDDNYHYIDDSIPAWEHRRCVNQFHPKDPSNYEGQYVEEDWADYFAAQIINELKPEMPYLKNFACLLIPEDEKGYVIYEDNQPDESHSQPIFRIIHVQRELAGGVLPESCKPFESERLRCEANANR